MVMLGVGVPADLAVKVRKVFFVHVIFVITLSVLPVGASSGGRRGSRGVVLRVVAAGMLLQDTTGEQRSLVTIMFAARSSLRFVRLSSLFLASRWVRLI